MYKKENKLASLIKKCIVTAGSIYLFNKLYSRYAVKKHALTAKPENYFEWKDMKVYYSKSGEGTPVILLHALHPASSSYEWHRVISLLAKSHTVYTLDLPGCGRSDKPDIEYTSILYVSLLADFISTMEIRHASVVTSNLTSAAAIMAAAYDPEMFDRMILISPPSAKSLEKTPDYCSKFLMKLMNSRILGSLIYNILTSRPQIDLAFTETYFYNPFHDTDELVDTYLEASQLGGGAGHYLAGSIIGRYVNINSNYAFSKLSLPVKLIEGAAAENADLILKEWTDLNPSVKTVMLEHTRQLPHLEEPEKVVSEILEFID